MLLLAILDELLIHFLKFFIYEYQRILLGFTELLRSRLLVSLELIHALQFFLEQMILSQDLNVFLLFFIVIFFDFLHFFKQLLLKTFYLIQIILKCLVIFFELIILDTLKLYLPPQSIYFPVFNVLVIFILISFRLKLTILLRILLRLVFLRI